MNGKITFFQILFFGVKKNVGENHSLINCKLILDLNSLGLAEFLTKCWFLRLHSNAKLLDMQTGH